MAYPGTPRKLGDTGEAVKEIQRALGVQTTGVFGVTTLEHVTRFQLDRGLTPDGVVGEKTWQALFFTPEPLDLGARVLQVAIGRVGVKERPLGSNRGPEVDEYNRFAGAPLGSYWCMSFVQDCIGEVVTGGKHPILKTASCSALYRWARDRGRLTARPEPGDIFLVRGGDTGHYHTGFCRKLLSGERFSTIEGNSNDDGSANGVCVAYRPRGRRLASCSYVRL